MLLYECLACRVPPTSGGECIELDRTVHAVLPPTECTCGCDMYARAMVLAHHCGCRFARCIHRSVACEHHRRFGADTGLALSAAVRRGTAGNRPSWTSGGAASGGTASGGAAASHWCVPSAISPRFGVYYKTCQQQPPCHQIKSLSTS